MKVMFYTLRATTLTSFSFFLSTCVQYIMTIFNDNLVLKSSLKGSEINLVVSASSYTDRLENIRMYPP